MNFLLTLLLMVLKISKCYSTYGFHLISAKLYEESGNHGEIRSIIFFGNGQVLKKFGTFKF